MAVAMPRGETIVVRRTNRLRWIAKVDPDFSSACAIERCQEIRVRPRVSVARAAASQEKLQCFVARVAHGRAQPMSKQPPEFLVAKFQQPIEEEYAIRVRLKC